MTHPYPYLHREPDVQWQRAYDTLLHDPYLKKKYDRRRRLHDKLRYIRDYCPELIEGAPASSCPVVVDVGLGPGEFLEWCRQFGWRILGVESPSGEGGMGSAYWELSRLMHWRQELPVDYQGFQSFFQRVRFRDAELWNFQGSWAQCWANHLDGEPHHEHHDAARQSWRWTESLLQGWRDAFDVMANSLNRGGHVLIAANGIGNDACRTRYDREIRRAAKDAGLELVMHKPPLLHKWVKP